MSVVVQKYGGSSVADVARLKAVARRVVETVRTGRRVVVVVSAMGNTTNELLALARSVSENPGRRELDLLVSVGERVSMTLLAMAIEDLGVPAASFTGSQSGIITDDNHVAARVVDVRPQRVQEALDAGRVAIVAGFQGVSRNREVTTLGRGGTDTTAVVMAAALGAEHCEICSDVDGVYSADPREVPDARRFDELPLGGAVAMGRAGSKVLLAEALEQASRLGVRLHAAATERPPGSGTRLPPGPAPDEVVAVVADDQLEHFDLPVGAVLPGLAARAWWWEAGRPQVLVDLRNLHDRGALVLPEGARSRGPVATVSLVGRRAVTDPVVGAGALDLCRDQGLVAVIALDATWSAVMPRDRTGALCRALHARFVSCAG